MTHTSTEEPEAMVLASKRRKDMAAWAVKNFKTWPRPHEMPDADPAEIGCELVMYERPLPVLRCKLGGGYVDSTTWFYAKKRAAARAAAPQPPQAVSVPPFAALAQRKLDDLLARGFRITGYSIERADIADWSPQRGFVTHGGLVGWWTPHQIDRIPGAQHGQPT